MKSLNDRESQIAALVWQRILVDVKLGKDMWTVQLQWGHML